MLGSGHRLVIDFAEDETRGNATEALVDFASAELVVASVLCAQPKTIFVFVNYSFNLRMRISYVIKFY